MSTLKELLNGVPVEWKILKDIANFTNGKGHEKVISENGKFIVVNSKFVSTEGVIVKFSNEQLSPIFKNDILIVMSDLPNGRALAKTFLVDKNDKYTLNQRIGRISVANENQLEPSFLNYILNRSSQLLKYNNGIDQTNLKKGDIENVKIPIPYPNDPKKSLEIQQKIVKVLDELSEQNKALTTALAEEIDNRKKQYEYYREELFRFEGKGVEWKTLESIALKISSGGTPKTNMPEYYNGNIPWLRTQEVGYGDIWDTEIKITEIGLKNSSANLIPINCVIVAMYGATVGRIGINKIPLTTNQACANIQVDPTIMHYQFLYYYLLCKYEFIKSLGTGSQTNINAGIIKKFLIPIPSLQEQERIVAILDKFDEATKGIVDALQAEIALRNKEYEYYRNKLLTFKGE